MPLNSSETKVEYPITDALTVAPHDLFLNDVKVSHLASCTLLTFPQEGVVIWSDKDDDNDDDHYKLTE